MIIVIAIDQMAPKTNGTVISTTRLIDSLRAQGHTVRVLAFGATGKDSYSLGQHHIPIVSWVAWKQKVVFAQYDEKKARQALKGADVMHLLMPFRLSYKLVNLGNELGVPVTTAFHVHPENILKNAGLRWAPASFSNFIFWLWRIRLYDKVSAIHCPSDFIAAELMNRKYQAKKFVFSNGVSNQVMPKKVQRLDDKFQILMIGRLASEKRQDLLIRAVAKSKYEDRIRLVFAGGGPRRWPLAKLSQLLLYNQPVFKFYEPNELIEEINRSDLYVHAADIEIEGISCLEAMSVGVAPLIARADKSATKQFIINPHCGFAAGSVKDLSAKIDWFIENPESRRQIQKEYLAYSKKFDIKYSVKAMERMFKHAIEQQK